MNSVGLKGSHDEEVARLALFTSMSVRSVNRILLLLPFIILSNAKFLSKKKENKAKQRYCK